MPVPEITTHTKKFLRDFAGGFIGSILCGASIVGGTYAFLKEIPTNTIVERNLASQKDDYAVLDKKIDTTKKDITDEISRRAAVRDRERDSMHLEVAEMHQDMKEGFASIGSRMDTVLLYIATEKAKKVSELRFDTGQMRNQ